jgi:hypothetical protein
MGYPGQPQYPPQYQPPPQQPRYPLRYTWVATPPPGSKPRRAPVRRAPYSGPPAYRAVPRWGLPALGWRTPSTAPGATTRAPSTEARVRRTAGLATALAASVALSALIACGGEVWRYVLLVLGRDEALSATVVAVSDTLVLTGALLALATGLLALLGTLRWLLPARRLAADRAGQTPGRPEWQVLLGVLAPLANLFLAGSVLAELEHAALHRGPDQRPRPTRLVAGWWLAWATSEVLAVITLLWGLRGDVQGRADGVLWHAVTDLAAAVLAGLTMKVVAELTELLAPAGERVAPFRQVLVVRDAPEPPLRPSRPAGSVR